MAAIVTDYPVPAREYAWQLLIPDEDRGLWLVAEIAPDVPLENVEAICSTPVEVRLYYQ